jgi:hypothetical protein
LARLLIDRTLAFEMVVVLGDGEHALAGNVSSAQDVFEKGNHILPRFGTAEGDDEQGVVVHAVAEQMARLMANRR